MRRKHFVADRRQYLSNGKRNPSSGGWLMMYWDERRQIYVEGCYHSTKIEALESLRSATLPTAQPVYCAACDIDHDTPEQCPEHDDYEPVRGLDRYPDVKVSDLADNE